MTDIILAILGLIGSLIAYIFHSKISDLQKGQDNIKEYTEEHLNRLEDKLETAKQSQGERIGDLEKRVALEYATRKELREAVDSTNNEVMNIRRLIEKLFDKIDDMKDSYVSVNTCQSKCDHIQQQP